MNRKTTAVLLLQRSEWFDLGVNRDAIAELDEDADRIALTLSPILDIRTIRSISTIETAEAVSVELRSIEADLIILIYQTRIDHFFLEKIIKGVGNRPLVSWCYLPWRRIPRPMTYEDLVKGSSLYAMTESLALLRELRVPFLAAFGSAEDPEVSAQIKYFALAAQISNELKNVKVGILCENQQRQAEPKCNSDLLTFGKRIIPYDALEACVNDVTNQQIELYIQELAALGIESMITTDTLRLATKVHLGLYRLAQEEKVDFLAVDDHNPSFRERFGICPGLPPITPGTDKIHFIPTTHEDGILASIILHLLSGSYGFVMRMWFWDRAKNIVVGGYGGIQSPIQISEGERWIVGDYECVRGDPDGGAQVEFVTRPGRVTLLQVQRTADRCYARAASGMCLESDPWIEGIPHAVVRLDCSIDHFLGRLSSSGGSPFWVMVYGSHLAELQALFELRAIDLEILRE